MPSIGVVLSHDHGRPRENSCKGSLYIFRARTATFELIEHARQMIACIYGAGPCARLYGTTIGQFSAIGAALKLRFIHLPGIKEALKNVIAGCALGLTREPDAAPSPMAAERTMKVGILAGGVGSRLSEETVLKPKPMVEIGGRPILWHIMMYYSHFGFNEFVIALGYKGEYIKKYMADYLLVGERPDHRSRPGCW